MSAHRLGSVVVTGDVAIDWFEVAMPPARVYARDAVGVHTWQTNAGLHRLALPGDALLVARLVAAALGTAVRAPDIVAGDEILGAHFALGRFPIATAGRADRSVYRVRQYKGLTAPAGGAPLAPRLADDDASAALVVLDDAGNGFRHTPDAWPAALRGEHRPLVVLKMGRPVARGPLWDALRERHADRLVVLLNADDLRREGVSVSRRLSWERTATDLVRGMAHDLRLEPLRCCAHVVVRFGVDGCIVVSHDGGEERATLFFDPRLGEDESADLHPGRMRGLGSAFVAGLAAHVARVGLSDFADGVRGGLLAARRLLAQGYGADVRRLDYPGAALFAPRRDDEATFVDAEIPRSCTEELVGDWSVLDGLSPDEVERAAYRYVVEGADAVLERVPMGVFRGLRTADRTEIESYRSIQNLIREYLAAPAVERPVSIAVFGPPGSGKSFGVTQVAESVAPGQLHRLEFNLSQFDSVGDLTAAFHRVRDVTLRGRTPFVFFDEFDADFRGKLGWLRHFLAPMQAGEFRDRDGMHPVGRGIFVFAGGTYGSFAEFRDEGTAAGRAFGDAKGPDFVSRLRGYVNVRGIDREGERDRLYVLRRALLLRTLLQQKAAHLFDRDGGCQIDPGVLRALLTVPAFRHGVRSLSAIVDISLLAGRKRFERASLPSAEQLELHVEAGAFLRAVVEDEVSGDVRLRTRAPDRR